MRIKKGFTLAEILIVLMVIGIIATMTIPGLMKGVQEAQYKTAFKKAYNTIVNLCAMASVNGELPAKGSAYSASGATYNDFFIMLARNLSVKGFIYTDKLNQGTVDNLNNLKGGLTTKDSAGQDITVGSSTNSVSLQGVNTWIVTEDNFAYTVLSGKTDGNCGTKLDINAQTSTSEAAGEACFVVAIDVNGLNKSPNIIEPQVAQTSALQSSKTLDTLSGDQYYIFVGRDGATSGNVKTTATGRLIGDVK